MIKKRTAVLISGRGSNMKALVEAAHAPDYPAKIVLVISNKEEAAGLEYARSQNIPALAITSKGFASREAHETAIHEVLVAHDCELVCLAGYMRILTPHFVGMWQDKMLNIHPSLLPDFPGLNTHQRAIDAGKKQHGCTVHFVTGELDAGPVVLQTSVPVMKGDDAERLGGRVLAVEHALYVRALAQVAGE
jgi:formyltetrahydrofolate-dependent phosphoribosylglycinamide formyltransferase